MILRKAIEIAATRCHILKLKFIKFDFGWESAQTLLGELTTLPHPLAGLKGPTSYGTGRKVGREGQVRGKGNGSFGEGRMEGDRRVRNGKEGEGQRTSERSPSSELHTVQSRVLHRTGFYRAACNADAV